MTNCFKYIFGKKKLKPNTNTINSSIKYNLAEEKILYNLENIKGDFYVESVYDGDTITILVPIKMHIYDMTSETSISFESDNNKSNTIYFNRIKLRLYGINAPEIKPLNNIPNRNEHIKLAIDAKKYLSAQILNKIVRVEFLTNDKYGRPLGKIYLNKICLNDLMIEKGYAKNYNGGTKDHNF